MGFSPNSNKKCNLIEWLLVLAAVQLLSAVALAQPGAELIARERYFYDQLKAGNLESLPAIFTEDFNGVFSGGVLTKADEVKGFQSAVLEDYTFSNIFVKFPTQDVGIIIYTAHIKGSYKGKDISGVSYHTSTYVLRKGRWLMTLHTEAAAPKEDTEKKKMNNEFLGISTAAYIVPELDKAKAWYSKAFGIEPYFDEPFYVGFNVNGYELGLQPEEGKRVTGNSSIAYWAVSDVKKTFAKFVGLGAEEVEKPTDVGGGVVVATVTDPWGNRIGLIFNPVFKK